jgi:probable phosphoglycerate mutase
MAILALLRHGPTDWNAERRLQGRSDIPLSAAGRQAVRQWRLPPWAASCRWQSSPLSRAVETAEILHQEMKAREALSIEPALIEMSYGQWEGRGLAELRREFGAGMAELEAHGLDFRPPGGESPRDVQDRLRPWLDELGRSDVTTLAIAHKGVMRAIYAGATGWDMTTKPPDKLRMTALQLFEVRAHGQVQIAQLNLPIADPALANSVAS